MKFKKTLFTQKIGKLSEGWDNPFGSMKIWFKHKDKLEHFIALDRYYCNVTKPDKKFKKRSIAIRKLKLLLSWDEKSFEELNCWCEHGVTCKQVKKHRIFVYTY